MIEERIIDRVRKLLAMTEAHGCTPEEAGNAAAKAQALLFEHNLSLSQVERPEGADRIQGASFDKTDFVLNASKFSVSWHRTLLSGICRSNFCKAIMGSGAKAYIIGRKWDVEVVVYLYQYLSTEIERLAKATVKSEGVIENKRRWKTSFCYGAVITVNERLRKQNEDQASQNASSTALVVVSAEALKRAVTGFFPRLGTLRGGRISNSNGYNAGREAGNGIALNRGIGSRPSQSQCALN